MASRHLRIITSTAAEIACEVIGWRALSVHFRARAMKAVSDGR